MCIRDRGQVDPQAQEIASQDDTDQWFEMSSDPEIAKAVAEARAVANKPVDGALEEPQEVQSYQPPSQEQPNFEQSGWEQPSTEYPRQL